MPTYLVREIRLKLNDDDYFGFLSIATDDNLTIEEKLKQIINYHLIVYRNKQKLKNERLM
ncbi:MULTISPECIES: hypothetical protein [Nitrosopumilus]|uniref:hypothetical protein n=1 Tax=Nitrosopumilus TaxID=338191 RepID=UPI000376410F|nr:MULTISPECIES: hypothetical protein [Nitrosopumilus]